MRKMKLSQQEVQKVRSEGRTLEDVVRNIEQRFCRAGEVITRIKVNGLTLSEIDEVRLSQTSADDIQEVEFEIQEVRDLVSETIVSSRLYAGSLKDLSFRLSDMLRFEETPETHRKMTALIDGLQSLTTAGILIDQVLQATGEGLQGWDGLNQGLGRLLSEIEASYTRRDFVSLADQIEYDLTRILDEYTSALGPEMDSSPEGKLP